MIPSVAVAKLDAARRADLIYAEARSAIDARLWRAALGIGTEGPVATQPANTTAQLNIASLLGLIDSGLEPASRSPAPEPASPSSISIQSAPIPKASAVQPATAPPAAAPAAGLGPNAGYAPILSAAARRTNIPAAALASIIDAEAAKTRSGAWQTHSRNPRSTATGLGQFLAGTWKSEAQRAGTWLNGVAQRNGWIDGGGRIRPEMQAPLLALRHDAEASINATADYARRSLDKLAAAGAAIGTTADEIAHAAYLGHNLGLGDAIRFLRDGLDDSRARRLLDAQVGSASAAKRIAAAGDAASAHRNWLLGFMARHVNASRFSA